MYSKINIHLIVLVVSYFAVLALAASDDGKYRPINDGKYRPVINGQYTSTNDGKYRSNPGKYVSNGNDGRYKPRKTWAYIHVDDMRHLGKYIHMPNPYIHIDNPALPYDHIDSPYDPYVDEFDRFGDSSFQQSVRNREWDLCRRTCEIAQEERWRNNRNE